MKKVYEKIEEAKAKLGLSSRALSVRIGHNASYLSQIRVMSTEKQERLIRELNMAISGRKIITDTQIILGLIDDVKDTNRGVCSLKSENKALNVTISDLESYKEQAAFDLTEAHKSINGLKERIESYRKDNSLLLKQLESAQENFAAANINNQLIEKKLASKEQILDDYYKDLDDLEKVLDEVCNQRDQLLDANKSLEDYYDVLACKNNRFGAYIFMLIVILSITVIAFMIYVQSH